MVRLLSLLLALPLLCANPTLAAPAPKATAASSAPLKAAPAKPTAVKPAAANDTAPEFSARRFRAHVAFLADDLLEGRGTGSRGHAIAAAYVAAQFEALGLKPAGEQGGWYQQVPLRTSMLAAQKPVISVTGPGVSRSFENGSDVLIGPSAFEREQDFGAPLVFAGYGIDAPGAGLDDYRGLDVRGKIVVVLAGSPSGVASETAAHFADQKAVMAAARGAIGMITLTTEESEKVAPWAVRAGLLGTPRMTWLGKDGAPLNDAPGIRGTATINGAAAEILFAGSGKTYAALRAEAAGGGRPAGFALRSQMRIKRSSVWTDVTSPEVIAALPGSDPKLKHEVVILMAHLDHLGLKQPAPKPDEEPLVLSILRRPDRVETESGAKQLTIEGEISNPTASSQPVPPIRVELKTKSGAITHHWLVPAPVARLGPGERARFTTTEAGIKPGAGAATLRVDRSPEAWRQDLVYNGALDNAAGIATMIEAARAFVEAGEQPRRTIMFIANTAEEKGLLGADYFAHHPTVPLADITAVVDLDMPLLLYDFTDVIAFGAEHSTVAQAVGKAARAMGIALSPDPMPEENIFVRSDHYMFVQQGVPAILLATGFASGGEAQWKHFLGNVYHSVGDDLTQPINWQAGAKYARLNYLISRDLADADERPRWYQGDYFGDLYAPNAPKVPRPR